MDWFDLTALELGAKIQAGEVSTVDAARACLRAHREKGTDGVHAFVTVTPEADAGARGGRAEAHRFRRADASAGGRADGRQGFDFHKGRAHDLRIQDAGKLCAGVRRDRCAEARRHRRGLPRQDQHGRVRDGLLDRILLFQCDPQPGGMRPACRAAPPAARRRRSRREVFYALAATRAAPSASPRPSAA